MFSAATYAGVASMLTFVSRRRAAAQAIVDAGRRTIVVGDVHGCAAELRDLLAKVAFRRGVDRLVFVGDMVSKGPDSAGVIDIAMENEAEGVLGNHDFNVLSHFNGKPVFHHDDHALVARTMTSAQASYLESWPFWLRIPEHNVLVVHAGLLPGSRPEDNKPSEMMNARSVRADGTLSRFADGEVFVGDAWTGPEHLVFGHDAKRKLQRCAHATGLDTGCCYGGDLTALVLPRWTIVSVPAREVWCPPGS